MTINTPQGNQVGAGTVAVRQTKIPYLKIALKANLIVLLWIIFAQAIATVSIAIIVSPDEIEAGEVLLSGQCKVLQKTGKPCRSCGMTRGVCAFFHGEFARAHQYNPAAVYFSLFQVCIISIGLRRILTRFREA